MCLYRERFEREKKSTNVLSLPEDFLFVVSKESIITGQASVTVYNYLAEAVKRAS